MKSKNKNKIKQIGFKNVEKMREKLETELKQIVGYVNKYVSIDSFDISFFDDDKSYITIKGSYGTKVEGEDWTPHNFNLSLPEQEFTSVEFIKGMFYQIYMQNEGFDN